MPSRQQETNISKAMAPLQHTMKILEKYAGKCISKKPFAFMQLPPELRNRVYEFALVNRKEPVSEDRTDPVTLVRQRNIFKRRRAPRGVLALSQVCNQVRSELRPLYMAVVRISTDLYDMPFFLSTWYPESNAIMQVLAPSVILLSISAEDVFRHRVVEMRHLFLTLARDSPPSWWVERQVYKYRIELLQDPSLYVKMNRLLQVLEYAGSAPTELLQDIQNGFISHIKFVTNQNGSFTWLLTVTNKGATVENPLNEEEFKRLEGYCQHLGGSTYIYMLIKIVNETGQEVHVLHSVRN
ncbi:hypothetical protein HRS9122_09769 [Pyrenophora teres f. teres]|nr:hypothetical protein HRS9122_09769 [Pyrenophora teres f. teres]